MAFVSFSSALSCVLLLIPRLRTSPYISIPPTHIAFGDPISFATFSRSELLISTSTTGRMNIAAMLEPTRVAPYPYMASASSSPLEPPLQQRLPSISHVASTLPPQHQLQPLSAHNMQQHMHIMPQSQSQPQPQPQPLSSVPPPRHALPPRVDSLSSVNSSTQGSVEYTPQPQPSSSIHRSAKDNTARRDSSASSSHTNRHQRRRPGGQTKAACLPCRKRKSKVCFIFLLPSHSLFSFFHLTSPRISPHARLR